MKLNDVVFNESYVVQIEHETKASGKNPNGPWTVRGTIRVEMKDASVADLLGLAEPTMKISRQRIRQTGTREDAVKHLNDAVVTFKDVGKKYVDPTSAFEAAFASWSKEKQEKYLEKLMGK